MKGIKYLMAFTVAVPLALGIGCKKKEEKVEAPPAEEAPVMVKKEDIVVSVPDFVKGKWKDIKVEVLDKETNKKTTVTIPLGKDAAVPGSKLKIKAESFLPEFRMEGTVITSASNEPKNPAAQIAVAEEGKEIFKGWLFTLYPATHPFEHPKYSLTLIGYTPAS